MKAKPLKDKCPGCGYYLVHAKHNKKPVKKCSNHECGYMIEEEVIEVNGDNAEASY